MTSSTESPIYTTTIKYYNIINEISKNAFGTLTTQLDNKYLHISLYVLVLYFLGLAYKYLNIFLLIYNIHATFNASKREENTLENIWLNYSFLIISTIIISFLKSNSYNILSILFDLAIGILTNYVVQTYFEPHTFFTNIYTSNKAGLDYVVKVIDTKYLEYFVLIDYCEKLLENETKLLIGYFNKSVKSD